MTINGPAPMMLGFFMNAAIDQNCEKYIKENGLEKDVEAAYKKLFDDLGKTRPKYQEELPEHLAPSLQHSVFVHTLALTVQRDL